MRTNDLKKGDRVRLRNGWLADIADNAKGNIRMAEVFGDFTEIGSVYSHDIVEYRFEGDRPEPNVQYRIGFGPQAGFWGDIEHTPAQLKLKAQVDSF